ncbi:MAG: hypothetical protein HW389_1060 [Bacteroidetes bacterium]|nr:hypothetical protein [Bacteroidota bacterium]
MWLRHVPFLSVLALSLSLVACTDKGDPVVSDLQPGFPVNYNYQGFDAKGLLVVAGTMSLTATDTTSVRGTWAFEGISLIDKIGPQVGSGRLVGNIQQTTISINLNPGWVDNNVLLLGTIESHRITGRWTWVTFAGPTTEGRFEAVRGL